MEIVGYFTGVAIFGDIFKTLIKLKVYKYILNQMNKINCFGPFIFFIKLRESEKAATGQSDFLLGRVGVAR